MVIVVTDEELKKLKSHVANCGYVYSFQFFSDPSESRIVLTSTKNDQNLGQLLSFLVDEEDIIVLVLKWNQQNTSIDFYQIGTSKGVLLIKNEGPSQKLQEFLTSHTFYMKGVSCDKQKLTRCLGIKKFSFIDIETKYLKPVGYPLDFMEIVRTFVGKPGAQFNDADWSGQLNLQQICYAAFDVVGLCKAIPNILNRNPPPPPPPVPIPNPPSPPPVPIPYPPIIIQNVEDLKYLIIQQNQSINQLRRDVIDLQAKLDQFPKNLSLKVITENEINLYLDYAISKYGVNFVNLYDN